MCAGRWRAASRVDAAPPALSDRCGDPLTCGARVPLQAVVERIAALVLPPASAARRGEVFRSIWMPGAGWTPER